MIVKSALFTHMKGKLGNVSVYKSKDSSSRTNHNTEAVYSRKVRSGKNRKRKVAVPEGRKDAFSDNSKLASIVADNDILIDPFVSNSSNIFNELMKINNLNYNDEFGGAKANRYQWMCFVTIGTLFHLSFTHLMFNFSPNKVFTYDLEWDVILPDNVSEVSDSLNIGVFFLQSNELYVIKDVAQRSAGAVSGSKMLKWGGPDVMAFAYFRNQNSGRLSPSILRHVSNNPD